MNTEALPSMSLAPAKASTLVLDESLTVEQAFIVVVSNCLDQLQSNQRGAVEQSDPEFIHQMRVAIRRMRSALSLFSAAVSRTSWEPWAAELRWLASELGPAREWDVLEVELLPPLVAQLQERRPLVYLPNRVKRECRKARREARLAIASPRYGQLALTIERWLNALAWRAQVSPEQVALLDAPVKPMAEMLLDRRHAQLRRQGRHLVHLSDEKRHRVRVSAKKLRYATEFFMTLYPRKTASAYLDALASLQDVLGSLNDEASTLRISAELCSRTQDPRCGEETSILAGWFASRMHQHLKQLNQTWKHYLRQHRFWHE